MAHIKRIDEMAGAENGAVRMVKMLTEISSGRQKEMYQQMSKDLVPIECTPLSEIFTDDEIKAIKHIVRPKMKGCYENAYHFASRMQEVLGKEILYCEGYMNSFGLPIEHAFNKVDGKYVDITAELILGDDVTKSEYTLIGEWDERTALKAMTVDGCYGCVYQKLYMMSHKDEIKN